QGWADVNCYGSKDLFTPNMDRLAREGVKFTQFYAAAPVCSPSRASMLTGMNPHAAGLPGNASSKQGEKGMPSDRLTLAELLKKGGYTTGHVGKWHLGYTPETMPNGQGFDYSFGHMGGCIDNYSHFFYWHGPNRHDLWENGTEIWADGQYFPDLMAEKAGAFLQKNQNNPFFLYYAINLPHYPLQPDEKWRQYYKDLPAPRKDYAAFISTIDDRIGILLKQLDDLGLRENTLIIFQSDHGYSTEERTFGGGGSAGPFRGAKFSLFEGGIRVPAILSWKGRLPENESRDQMALNIDWLPTVAELCHLDIPANVEGKSLVPLLKNESQPSLHETFVWQNGGSWAVRKNDWKLLGNPKDTSHKGTLDPQKDRFFLVQLTRDSTEMTNMASKYPNKVQELLQVYRAWPFAKDVE
ncbi:MAG: sulfatase-like hydrolase/transferase, partial [Bacteroidota bacterium]